MCDFACAIAFTLGLFSLLSGINNGENWGWISFPTLVSIIIGIALLVIFYIIERRTQFPIIDLSLFRNRTFLMGNISGWLSFVAMFGNSILLPFYLQYVLHYSPSQVGLFMMAFPVSMAIVAPLSGHASDKFGPIALTSSGLFISGIGLFYFSTLTASAQSFQIILGSLLIGMGSGLFQSPNNSSVMSSVPTQKLSVAGGINSLVRNLGMIIGIAFSVSTFEALGGVSKPNPGQIEIFMSAYHTVMLISMGIAFIGAIISLNRRNCGITLKFREGSFRKN